MFCSHGQSQQNNMEKRLLNDSNAKWKCTMKHQIKPFSLLHFTECNLDNVTINSIGIEFYCQMFNVWSDNVHKYSFE